MYLFTKIHQQHSFNSFKLLFLLQEFFTIRENNFGFLADGKQVREKNHNYFTIKSRIKLYINEMNH